MRRRFALSVLTALLVTPATAGAEFFPAEPVDGPTADIQSVGDVDVARDGTGAVAYVKRDGGVDHIFVSRLANGVFQAPERVDPGLDAASSQPVVAASDGGRVAVLYVSGGQLFSVVRPAGAPTWTNPSLVAAGGSNPSADMSINGVGYASFTVGADVRVARLERNGTTFAVVPDPLDITPARPAGETPEKRSRIAVAADGTALVVWSEEGGDGRNHVFARRVFEMRLSTAPQDLTLGELEGRPGGTADSPDVDIEDDSSWAWVVFRQDFGGQSRAIARELVGSQFEPPVVVDGLGWGGEGAVTPRIELNGRGEGMSANGTNGTNATFISLLKDEQFLGGQAVGHSSLSRTLPVPTIAETQDRVIAWLQSGPGDPGSVHARFFDDQPDRRTPPQPGDDVTLSDPALGPVDTGAGMDAAMNRAGDAVAAFVQGTGNDRRVVAGTYDRPPGSFRGYTTTRWRKFARPPLAWGPSFDLWGPITYTIEVDGQPAGTTQDTRATLPGIVPDGEHRWRVVATDRKGQVAASPTRPLRVDATEPRLSISVRRRGRVVTVTARASDVIPPSGRASGVRYVRIDWGDRSGRVTARRASHRYSRNGRFRIRVSATDRAGNAKVRTKRIKVG